MVPSILRLLLAAALATTAACSETSGTKDVEEPPVAGDVVPRGDRLLGIAISDRSDGDFNAAYLEAVDAGMQFTSLSLQWDGVETTPGVYAPDPNFLEIAAAFYAPRGTGLILALNPIDTNNRRVPPHLAGRSWDDPVVIDAFKALLDALEGLEADQGLMLAGMQVHVPFVDRDVAGVERTAQHLADELDAHLAMLVARR